MKKILLGLLVFLLGACASKEAFDKSQVTVGLGASPITKDAHKVTDNISRSVIVHLYDGLVTITTNGSLEPGLATSWEYKSPTNLVFTLRQGVTFHDGQPLTAEDVIASLDRLKSTPESESMYNKIKSITKVDDKRIMVNLVSPYPSIVGYLSHAKAAIYPKTLIDQIGTNAVETPIGTGPYMYEEWVPGDRVTLKANPNYWDGAPAIETLNYKVILDESVRAIAMETGDVQVVLDIGAAAVDGLKAQENVTLVNFKHIGVDYLGFNMQSPALANLKLREAISMAVDKQAIIDAVLFGLGAPAATLFDNRMFGALTEPDPIIFDPAAAKKIIEEEGLTGTKLTLLANEGARSKQAEIIQSYLKEIGIELEINILEWGTYLETLKQGDHQLFLLGWSNSSFDPDSSLYTIFHTDSIAVGNNNTFYSNPKVDALIEKAAIELDPKIRAKYYEDAQRFIRNDRANLFLYARDYTLAFKKGLEGVRVIPTGDHKLHKLEYK